MELPFIDACRASSIAGTTAWSHWRESDVYTNPVGCVAECGCNRRSVGVPYAERSAGDDDGHGASGAHHRGERGIQQCRESRAE